MRACLCWVWGVGAGYCVVGADMEGREGGERIARMDGVRNVEMSS
jgi:hypothetical protein